MNIVAQSIYFEDKAETSEPLNKEEESCHNQIKNMRKKLELSDSPFKATRAELEQQVAERKEENNCYEEKVKMKESDIAMRLRHFAEMATT